MSRPRAVVCLSGGMDSTVCAALAARDFEAYGLHFSYGQRTEAREIASAREVARLVGLAELLELRTDLFRRIGAPLIAKRKHGIVRLGVELGAPLHVSWSCYAGEAEACGVCESCELRLRAFAEAGVMDPIPYAASRQVS